MLQAATRGVQNKQGGQIPADVGYPLLIVGRHFWRQAAACHNEFGRASHPAKFIEELCLIAKRQLRTRKHAPVLLAGAVFVDGETLPGTAADFDAVERNARIGEQIGKHIAGGTAGRKDRGNRRTERTCDACNVDATPPGSYRTP